MPAQEGPIPAKTILVVEDDRVARELAAEALEDEGYRVVAARDAAAGLAALAEGHVGLILLDHGTGPVPDEALVRAARALPRRVPVLLWTGWHDAEARARALGAVGAVPKPVDLDALLARVREEIGAP